MSGLDPSAASGWDDYDHLAAAAMEDPAPLLTQLRASCPVGHSRRHGGFYVLTRYADCTAAARDPLFSSSTDRGPGPGFPFGHTYPLPMCMIADDAPRHRDFRRPLQDIFSARSAAAMAPAIRATCQRLIDGFIERGTADLAEGYAAQVPGILTCELLDLPRGDRARFQGWAHEIVATGGDTDAMAQLVQYTDELYDLRRARPGDDIPSLLLGVQVQGQPITRTQWRGTVVLLVLAGLDTVANAGALALHLIGTRDDLRAHLLEDPARIRAALPEILRWTSPVPQHSRGVTAEVEMGGHRFEAGDVVQLNWLAANRDPEQFQAPDSFDVQRAPNRHLAFGHGPHRCLGEALALVELEQIIGAALERIPDFRIVPAGTVRYPSLNRAISHLHVVFTPGRRLHAESHTGEST
ncbi:MAG: cytochrome P450 [Gammaproteobacteria bacterium]